MQITSSSIQMQAQHQSRQALTREESLQLRIGPPGGNPVPASGDLVTLSTESLSAAASAAESGATDSDSLAPGDRLKVEIIRHLFKRITGHDMVMSTPGESRQTLQGGGSVAVAPSAQAAQPTAEGNPAPSAGFGLAYDSITTLHESEATTFTASGTINTADGKEIQFSVQVNMSREFSLERRVSLQAGDPVKVDPLVVNYAGNAAELGDTRFEFDLDSDGSSEQISNLKSGSALLALDKNGNGSIDNGKELFGPTSGNGFAELSRYDQNSNGFIDSNDAVYDKLRLWIRDDSGGSRLVALGQAGIGAIYLGNVNTPFQLNDAGNRNLGQVASTGLFFREDGGAGTVQQVDYTV